MDNVLYSLPYKKINGTQLLRILLIAFNKIFFFCSYSVYIFRWYLSLFQCSFVFFVIFSFDRYNIFQIVKLLFLLDSEILNSQFTSQLVTLANDYICCLLLRASAYYIVQDFLCSSAYLIFLPTVINPGRPSHFLKII